MSMHAQEVSGKSGQKSSEATTTVEMAKATKLVRTAADAQRIPAWATMALGDGLPPGLMLQTKLTVNTPGDRYEQEADRISEQVMRMPEPQLQRACTCGGVCPNCQAEQQDQEQVRLQTKRVLADDTGQVAAPPIVHEVLRSPGQPLDPATHVFMEQRFGHDFSRVRVHSDADAEQSARNVNAKAYTVGQDIVFASGQYAPHTTDGRKLLAHELTHVVQQGNGTSLPASGLLPIDTSGETVAEQASDKVISGQSAAHVSSGHVTSIQRQPAIEFPAEPFVEGGARFGPEVGVPSGGTTVPPSVPLPEIGLPGGEVIYPPPPVSPPGEVIYPPPPVSPQGAPWLIPQTLPVPPVFPVPREGTEPDEESKRRKRRTCGSPDLPETVVSFFPGPLGQGGGVKASPLTLCPGNTVGSKPQDRFYKDQFKCIEDAGQKTLWVPGHILHGKTDRAGDRNLHGPGDTAKNLIIIDQTLNQAMSSWIEQVVLDLVYGPRGARAWWPHVLWYHAWVDSYYPGLPFFADSISVEYGPFDTRSGTEGPRWNFGQFTLGHKPPYCPAGGFAGGVFPWMASASASGFQSTLQVCHRELESRAFHVADGGLTVAIDAKWVGRGPGVEAAGTEGQPEGCPRRNYQVALFQEFPLAFDRPISTTELATGRRVVLPWRGLDDGDYYLKIWSFENPDPSCCLEGDITVTMFDAPGPKSRRHMEPV
jgi:uncharacterized protein DUF4157